MKPRENDTTLLVTAAASTAVVVAIGSLLSLALPTKTESPFNPSSLLKRITLRVKFWILTASRLDERLIVLLPKELESESAASNGSPRSITTSTNGSPIRRHQQDEELPYTLVLIFPGANLQPNDYVAIGTVLQEQASLRLIVGISVDPYKGRMSRLTEWALNGRDPSILANFIQQKAERLVKGRTSTDAGTDTSKCIQDIYNPLWKSTVFQDLFLWGHSAGGLFATKVAYPSKYKGLILYGCSMSLATQDMSKDVEPKTLLASYPRPVLTMMGERDGNLRCYRIAEEAKALQDDLERTLKCCTGNADDVKRASRLRKPVIILPELNHMQMALGVLPQISLKTGRADFVSPVSLHRAHQTIAAVVLDFIQIHCHTNMNINVDATVSTPPSNTSNGKHINNNIIGEAQNRLLQIGKTTQTVYLEPWLRLNDPTYQCRFLTDIQRQLLHVTVDGKHPFQFYEDDYDQQDESSYEGAAMTTIEVVPQWHVQQKDFLYARPNWNPDTNQIQMHVVPQDNVSISFVPQLSKTLAFKGRSQEEILFNQNKYHEIKDSPAPTLMELNQQTFDKVLHHIVTPTQRRRYLANGKKLRFGPDRYVPVAPEWVQQPISITKLAADDGGYYLWQSTFTTTPLTAPKPYGGAWYGKPLSPAQAYEWIVFDAFKP